MQDDARREGIDSRETYGTQSRPMWMGGGIVGFLIWPYDQFELYFPPARDTKDVQRWRKNKQNQKKTKTKQNKQTNKKHHHVIWTLNHIYPRSDIRHLSSAILLGRKINFIINIFPRWRHFSFFACFTDGTDSVFLIGRVLYCWTRKNLMVFAEAILKAIIWSEKNQWTPYKYLLRVDIKFLVLFLKWILL